MFSFFKRRQEQSAFSDFGFLGVDIHSHLIPGIDDGVPDLETALICLRAFEELGYKKVVTTPHVLRDYYPNSSDTIRRTEGAILSAGRCMITVSHSTLSKLAWATPSRSGRAAAWKLTPTNRRRASASRPAEAS